ncbi:Peptidyl-prolyl cis-trans isomerase E [Hondaea fermentalgiana]|uniref:Peptidyl-prolyl cis-trans isomerase E n=1 Tax=Hondaea fermentalgiana TaxID=2315210 RepID=A0A2R5GER0_9STRA|nr:Peptidyl-prolyl cis-trans isomerase E [Hondaea fermentalgiana]|eukprot:GBG28789.1 Peptidyl-prolyl cis-trans isomerase E [Hondaea fermentalgiana]
MEAAPTTVVARSVRVRDLPETASEALLRALFVPFGEVSGVRLGVARAPGGRPVCSGDALVTMSEAEDAVAASENLHNSEVFGKVIRVKAAGPQDFADLGVASS